MSLLLAAGEHGHLEVGFSVGTLGLRVLLLAAVPVVAAFAVLRGFLGEPGRRMTVVIALAAAASATMELLLSGGFALPEQTIPLILAALALPVYLALSRDERFARAVALGRRFAPLVVALAGTLAAVRFAMAVGAGRERTTVLLHTGVLLTLAALVWFTIARPRGRTVTAVLRVGAAVLGVALLAATAQAVILRPADPVPGVATRTTLAVGGADVGVLVVPNLPGWNLVHVSAATAAVGTARDALTPADPVPGATGGWVAVDLPAGRADLWVGHAGAVGSFTTDTGTQGTAPDAFAGADGPECASAALGRMLASGTATGLRCPSAALDPQDAATLRMVVDSLAGQGHRRIALAGDTSPRGRAAAALVRAEAAARGAEVVSADAAGAPLLLTSGWADAGTRLRGMASGTRPADGVYLAPWLLTAPLLAVDAGQHVGTRVDVAGASFQRYRAALGRAYPGQPASDAGYRAWLGKAEPGTARLRGPRVSTVE